MLYGLSRVFITSDRQTYGCIMQTCTSNVDRLTPHFEVILKLGFTGVPILSLFKSIKIAHGYSLEQPL